MAYQTLAVNEISRVAHIELARPDKANALNAAMWDDLRAALDWLGGHAHIRAAVLSGQGANFTAGLDFEMFLALRTQAAALPESERAGRLDAAIAAMQDCVSAFEACPKPIVAAVHGACYGAGVDIITACDIRLAAAGARFSVKEIDLAIVADLGTLQRLPGLVGEGRARELAFTGRTFDSQEALEMGLVQQVFADGPALRAGALELASVIAAKSPRAIRALKQNMNYSREHSLEEGLRAAAAHNAGALFSRDFEEALSAAMQKRPPVFED